MRLTYRILNVFTVDGARLSGNPLCVFEDGRGLSTDTMLALARQFNLSETTFILPADNATAALRIFTPALELPFAGHPTLGSAHVVRDLFKTGAQLTLSMPAGHVPVSAEGSRWTLKAGKASWRSFEAGDTADLASALGLDETMFAAPPLWVSTGMEQLLVPLKSAEAVERATPGGGLSAFANDFGKVGVYVFSPIEEQSIQVRFFFGKAGGILMEDPATGSACANLGAYAIAGETTLPLARNLRQGEQVARPSRLHLAVDRDKGIFVGGEVIELGRGEIAI